MNEKTVRILQTLESQLNHRLEKLWRVFSWCSSILISITGGVIVANRGIDQFKLYQLDRFLISCIIIIVSAYGWAWIEENLKIEINIRNQIDKIFEEEFHSTHLKELRPDKAKFGYKSVILLLGLVAIATTWSDYFLR